MFNIKNGGHKQCEGYVTLKEKLSVRRLCDIERKTFLIKALISRNVEQDVMNKL